MFGFTDVLCQRRQGFSRTGAPVCQRRWGGQVSVHIGLAERRRSSGDVTHGDSVDQVFVLGTIENNAIMAALGYDLHASLHHS
jgi:hypothetical protein